MTRERAAELWPIMKAYSEGKKVQYESLVHQDEWIDDSDPDFLINTGWRIKPEPATREATRDEIIDFVAEHPNCLVRLNDGEWHNAQSCEFYLSSEMYSYCLVIDGKRTEAKKFRVDVETGRMI